MSKGNTKSVQVTMYQISNGQRFPTREEAEKEEALLQLEGILEGFLETLGTERSRKTAGRIIKEFTLFAVERGLKAQEETSAEV